MQVHFALQSQLPPAPAEASMSKLMVVHGDLDKRCNLPIKCHSSNSLPLPFLLADPYRHLSKTDNISEKPEKTIKRRLGKNSEYIKSHTHTHTHSPTQTHQLAIITKPTESGRKGGRGGEQLKQGKAIKDTQSALLMASGGDNKPIFTISQMHNVCPIPLSPLPSHPLPLSCCPCPLWRCAK